MHWQIAHVYGHHRSSAQTPTVVFQSWQATLRFKMKRTMSKIILVVLLAVVFCLFATVPALAIAQRRQTRTLTPQAADQVFNSENEGEHGSYDGADEVEEEDVDDDKNATASSSVFSKKVSTN